MFHFYVLNLTSRLITFSSILKVISQGFSYFSLFNFQDAFVLVSNFFIISHFFSFVNPFSEVFEKFYLIFLEAVVSNFIIISQSLSFVKCFLKVFYENFFRSRCDTLLLYHFFAVLSSAFQAFFQNRSILEALYPLPSQTAYLLYHFRSPLSTLFLSFCVLYKIFFFYSYFISIFLKYYIKTIRFYI